MPLLLLGYQESDIEGMVEFPTSWLENITFDGVKTVAQVVQYYEEVKAGDAKNLELPKSKWNRVFYVDSLEQLEEGKSLEHVSLPIYVLLERGTFTPPKNNLYYQSEKWDHDDLREID